MIFDGSEGGQHYTWDYFHVVNQVNDETNVPQTGPMNRIMASHYETEQGAAYTQQCTKSSNDCPGWLRGRLQPYSIYVPSGPQPSGGYGLTLPSQSLRPCRTLRSSV